MSPFAIICLVFGSVLFTLAIAAASFFFGASLMRAKYRKARSEQELSPMPVFTRRYPESEVR